ncbi:hypothetical protein POX_e06382 [Penicillium oxalicum]|uniref:hypothetical protein n=1 Tax=Penicillium oxalicum TaxID=69781 RepID=UPI0020B73122|nr:hypothetical protein POX_e06382 [Penicillium oxalicum]KAI2788368.1 hypothetical protein POX_e06382 [Penicillium oxalicum]
MSTGLGLMVGHQGGLQENPNTEQVVRVQSTVSLQSADDQSFEKPGELGGGEGLEGGAMILRDDGDYGGDEGHGDNQTRLSGSRLRVWVVRIRMWTIEPLEEYGYGTTYV